MDQPQPGKPTDYSTHSSTVLGTDYWADKPASERPAKPQKSNVPEPNPHTDDPWNKSFKD